MVILRKGGIYMKMKKLLAILLAAVLLVSAVPFSAGAEQSAEPYVAKMYICTRTRFAGHVWLYFENLTDGEIKVGCYTVPAGQGVTVSAYNTARKDGKGNYYNIDGYCLNKYGSGGTTCASTYITASQLDTVSRKIRERNTWSGGKNCCYFAGSVWNSVADRKLTILLLPFLMGWVIGKNKCSTPKFYYPAKEQCFKQVGTGDTATLRVCSDGSYNRYVG